MTTATLHAEKEDGAVMLFITAWENLTRREETRALQLKPEHAVQFGERLIKLGRGE